MGRKITTELTERQANALKVIREHVATHGYPPSVRELSKAIGSPNPNAGTQVIHALERKGYVVRDLTPNRRNARTLRLADQGERSRLLATIAKQPTDVLRALVKGLKAKGRKDAD